jgi:molybdopterin molybdotransferase
VPQFQLVDSKEGMIEVEEALERVLALVSLLGVERVSIDRATGRCLREEIVASYDLPSADNSAMDGYAVVARDVAPASPDHPVKLRVVGDAPAGRPFIGEVSQGTAVRIMTGAPIPQSADAVVQVEWTDGGEESVEVQRPVAAGANIRRRGEDMAAGSVVLRRGERLGPGEIGVLASCRRPLVTVGRRPVVAILSTGDELIDFDQPMRAGAVPNSNAHALAALTREAGADARIVGIVGDERQATIAALRDASAADFIVTSGGVSVGAWDFVKEALDALGAETSFWRVAMKPGKPLVVSRLGRSLVFGLPGNPVSSMVGFHLFLAPALRKAAGFSPPWTQPVMRGRLAAAVRSTGDRRTYLRVRLTLSEGELSAQPMKSQGSGVLTSMIGANGLGIVPKGVTELPAGREIEVVLIGPLHAHVPASRDD